MTTDFDKFVKVLDEIGIEYYDSYMDIGTKVIRPLVTDGLNSYVSWDCKFTFDTTGKFLGVYDND